MFVSRSDQDSRRKTVEEIKRRAQSDGKWPQVLYAPTGCQMVFGISRLQTGSFLHFLAGCFRWFVGGEVRPSFWKIKHKILIYTQKKKKKSNLAFHCSVFSRGDWISSWEERF